MAGAGSRPFSCLRRLWHDGDSCETNRPGKGKFEFTRRLPVIGNAQVTPVLAAVVTGATGTTAIVSTCWTSATSWPAITSWAAGQVRRSSRWVGEDAGPWHRPDPIGREHHREGQGPSAALCGIPDHGRPEIKTVDVCRGRRETAPADREGQHRAPGQGRDRRADASSSKATMLVIAVGRLGIGVVPVAV